MSETTSAPQPDTPAPRHPAVHSEALTLVRSLLEIVVIAIFIVTFVVQPFRIPSASMQPTLQVGDFGLADKQSFALEGLWARLLPPDTVQRGDLVIFYYPVDPHLHLVKRVVGVPGDRVRLRHGLVWINGSLLTEPYAFYSPSQHNIFRDEFPLLHELQPGVDPMWRMQLRRVPPDGEVTVPPGHYFVLGDNRNDSDDSRYWGFVPRSQIVGRPLLVYFSLRPPDAGPGNSGTPLQRLSAAMHQFRILR